MRAARVTACLVVAALGSGCEEVQQLLDPTPPESPREAYVEALEDAGLGNAELTRRWTTAASQALSQPLDVDPPYQEVALFQGERPEAVAFRIELARGQRLRADLDVDGDVNARVFVELFAEQPTDEARRLASVPDTARSIEFEATEAGRYVLRLQPELLSTLRIRLRLFRAAALAFPVADHDSRAIRSRFGAPRDAGRRSHHGVDIFAPRNTPVVSAVRGRVRRVGTNRLGGNIIWLTDDERGLRLYYAHLETQLVRRGERVEPGDTLGLVGNSGNARTTPPHLHFGIYQRRRGPIDPYHFIDPQPAEAPRIAVDSTRWTDLGSLARTRTEIELEGGATLPRYSVVRLSAVAGRGFRVTTPAGLTLDVQDGQLESLGGRIATLEPAGPIHVAPSATSPILAEPEVGTPVAVVGTAGPFDYVVLDDGRQGWAMREGVPQQ